MSNPASQLFDKSHFDQRTDRELHGAASVSPSCRRRQVMDGVGPACTRTHPSWPQRVWQASMAACLPQRCALCTVASGASLVCVGCDRALPRLPPTCPRCALPTPGGAVCGPCTARPPPFGHALAAFAYAFPLDRLLQQFKYAGHLALAAHFAEAIASRIRVWPNVLVALPLAPRRQRTRGYNQAAEIARALARCGGVPVADALVRTRDTTPQAELHGAERARNMHGAFAARSSLAGMRVAIVDDVMTTGATLRAAAAAARSAGACEVDAWVVARTLPRASFP